MLAIDVGVKKTQDELDYAILAFTGPAMLHSSYSSTSLLRRATWWAVVLVGNLVNDVRDGWKRKTAVVRVAN